MGILLSIPIAIIYNLFISKLAEMMTKNDVLSDKIQKNIIIEIIAGIAAIVLAYTIFNKTKLKNTIVKYGLLLGGIILLIYSMVCNWDSVADVTKLCVIGGALLFIVLYSYGKLGKKEAKESRPSA